MPGIRNPLDDIMSRRTDSLSRNYGRARLSPARSILYEILFHGVDLYPLRRRRRVPEKSSRQNNSHRDPLSRRRQHHGLSRPPKIGPRNSVRVV